MTKQTPVEEQLNTWSHGIGIIFGIIALVLLIINVDASEPWALFSVSIYGVCIIVLFSASTLYHAVTDKKLKHQFRILDHISIYLLIAGTYTPVSLISLNQSLGWELFWIVWGIALFGVILKCFFTGKFEIFSTLLYLVMGWLVVLDFSNLKIIIESDGVFWLFAGGLAYTVGIIFYGVKQIPYNHVIWHLFVLAGAICHFLMVFLYVI